MWHHLPWTYKNKTLYKNAAIENLSQEELMEVKEQFKKNILLVSLFFTDLTVIETTETPLITGYNALANVGGALGLYLGGSLIACCEVFEIILRCFMVFFDFKKSA